MELASPPRGAHLHRSTSPKMAALEENDPSLIAAVLGDIARAKGTSQMGKRTKTYTKKVTAHVFAGELSESRRPLHSAQGDMVCVSTLRTFPW